jgi:hypothetical protein
MQRIEHAPPITRVHNLFRLRTVLNAVTKLHENGKIVTDDEIATLLAKKRLSKYKPKKLKDRIGRRARDHLKTLIRIGLAWRVKKGRRFDYRPTPVGEQLYHRYEFMDECPKDPFEEAIFTDRLMRTKLVNPYETKFLDYRTRPCLTVLFSLKQASLHLYHLGLILGEKEAEPHLNPQLVYERIKEFLTFGLNERGVEKLVAEYRINEQKRKSIRRDTKPILDWCRQLNLIDEKGDWYTLTNRGEIVLSKYKERYPLWYNDLGDIPNVKSALLSFYQFLKSKGLSHTALPKKKIQVGFFKGRIDVILREIEENIGVVLFNKDYTKLVREVDFSLWYDVPPEVHKEIFSFIQKKLAVNIDALIQEVELKPVKELEKVFKRGDMEFKQAQAKYMAKTIETTLPTEIMPTPGIFSSCKSPFEKESLVLLRFLNLKTQKYHGVFMDYVSKSLTKYAENNPDHLITNGFHSLVECKSTGEWGKVLRITKGKLNEMLGYQKYAEEVNASSAIFVYEGEIDNISRDDFSRILIDLDKIVIISRKFLSKSLGKPDKMKLLKDLIIKPESFRPSARILG